MDLSAQIRSRTTLPHESSSHRNAPWCPSCTIFNAAWIAGIIHGFRSGSLFDMFSNFVLTLTLVAKSWVKMGRCSQLPLTRIIIIVIIKCSQLSLAWQERCISIKEVLYCPTETNYSHYTENLINASHFAEQRCINEQLENILLWSCGSISVDRPGVCWWGVCWVGDGLVRTVSKFHPRFQHYSVVEPGSHL